MCSVLRCNGSDLGITSDYWNVQIVHREGSRGSLNDDTMTGRSHPPLSYRVKTNDWSQIRENNLRYKNIPSKSRISLRIPKHVAGYVGGIDIIVVFLAAILAGQLSVH